MVEGDSYDDHNAYEPTLNVFWLCVRCGIESTKVQI